MTLSYFQTNHPAWRSLSGPALKVFIELRSRFNGANNGRLHLSLRKGAALIRISQSTVKRAFAELEAKGFIVKTKPGQWYGRKATEWRLTDHSCDGHLATRDWQNWKPEPKRKPNPRYRGGTYSKPDGAVSVPKT